MLKICALQSWVHVFLKTPVCVLLKVSSETPTPIVKVIAVLLSTGQYFYIIFYQYDVKEA